jgi:hypothetical protein
VRLGYDLRADDLRAVCGDWPPKPPPKAKDKRARKVPRRDLRAFTLKLHLQPNPTAVAVIRLCVIVGLIVGAWIGIGAMASEAPLNEGFVPYRMPASTLNDAPCGAYAITVVWLESPGNPTVYRVLCSEGEVTWDWQY